MLTVDARIDSLPQVLAFVDEQLEAADCPVRIQAQIDVAVEEIFVNIAHYAYREGGGKAEITFRIDGDPAVAEITFRDSGVPFNPLESEDPDITLSAAERDIGGLGIYMVKKSMDRVSYEYRDGMNVLTLRKTLSL